MRIERIELQNFRGFERFEMDLHPNVTLLVGENGAGKTALIDALAVMMGWTASALSGSGFPVTAEDVRRAQVERDGLVEIEKQGPLMLGGSIVVAGAEYLPNHADRVSVASLRVAMANLAQAVQEGAKIERPVLVRYPAYRGWAKAIRTNDNPSFDSGAGYMQWHEPAATQTALVTWIRRYTYVELQESQPVPQLQAIKRAIRDTVEGHPDITYNIRNEELRLAFDDGRVLGFQHLSDGYRNILAMVADIAWRCVVLNPHLEDRATTETEGVVLIDELELHLHPRWQREILGALRRAFPRIQVIATTHSPQVISTAEPEWIRLLTGAETPIVPTHVRGRDTNALLEDIMGVPGRPEWARDELDKLFTAIDAERLDEARHLVTVLETALGPDDGDLTRARFMLDMDDLETP